MAEIKIREVSQRIDLGSVNHAPVPAEAATCPNCKVGGDTDGDGNCAVCKSPVYQQAVDKFVPSAEAQAAGICHTREECRQMYAALDPEKQQAAIAHLHGLLAQDTPESQARFKKLLEQYGAEDFVHHLYDEEIAKLTEAEKARGLDAMYISQGHLGFGMAVRNALRNGGFGEDVLGVHNLDDIYVELVAEAIRKLA